VALTYLADTSALTRLREDGVRQRILDLAQLSHLGVSNLCRLELGYSARSGSEWDEIQEAIRMLSVVDIQDSDVESALMVQRSLALAGHRGRKIVDLLVAAAARRLRLVVLHYDRDFDYIAQITGQPCEWIAPAGSLD
jgi:predicted nucleic acid-binding protein